jgi:hypothetical protein
VGEGTGVIPSDLADFDEPRSAAAAAGPADPKFEVDKTSSCFFFPPNRPPRNLSFSFFLAFSDSFSLSFSFLSFFEKNPPFFDSFSLAELTVKDEAPDSVRERGGRASSEFAPSCSWLR